MLSNATIRIFSFAFVAACLVAGTAFSLAMLVYGFMGIPIWQAALLFAGFYFLLAIIPTVVLRLLLRNRKDVGDLESFGLGTIAGGAAYILQASTAGIESPSHFYTFTSFALSGGLAGPVYVRVERWAARLFLRPSG